MIGVAIAGALGTLACIIVPTLIDYLIGRHARRKDKEDKDDTHDNT